MQHFEEKYPVSYVFTSLPYNIKTTPYICPLVSLTMATQVKNVNQ